MKSYRFARAIGGILLSIPILIGCSHPAIHTQPTSHPQINDSQPELWLQITSPKATQILKSGTLVISGQLSGTERVPYIHVTLYQSSNYNYSTDGAILTQENISVQSKGAIKGSLTVPEFSKSKGHLFFLVFKYPDGQYIVPLH